MMPDQMDTNMDNPSFDLQSTHISFEERQWLFKQQHLYKLDNLIQPIINLHKKIRGYEQFSIIPTLSSMIEKVSLNDDHPLYYASMMNGCTDNQIDQFRLYYQQLFLLMLNDLSTISNYHIFFIIMEGFIFYSSQTAGKYISLMTHEMQRCLSSFEKYIRSRSLKTNDLILFLEKLSLSSYTLVHTSYQNNIGILFQLLPKIQYYFNTKNEYISITNIDEYGQHIISPEELRYIDYSMNLKTPCHTESVRQAITNTPVFLISKSNTKKNSSSQPFPLPFQILHSLPIVYPYDDNMIYSQNYPSFWTGNNHTNENSNALFQTIPIEKNTSEFLFVQRLFYKTVPEIDINIAFIERIQNAHLWEKFRSHRLYMQRKNGKENLNENWLFHGTKSDNHHHIMSHGFNRSYCRDYVYYGRGVYFSRYACYSCQYSDRQDLSSLFLCRVLVGNHTSGSNDLRVPPTINVLNGKTIQADSTTDHKNPYTMVCTFHDDQNYPEYIITYMNKLNER